MIRGMTHADLARVVEIARASLPEAWTLEGFTQELDKSSCVGLVAGDPVIGLALGAIVADEMEVLVLVVDPASRRAGVGATLLGALLDRARARGVVRCFLEVRAGNAAAIALYTREGFVEVGVRRGYYRDGQDARLMASVLATS